MRRALRVKARPEIAGRRAGAGGALGDTLVVVVIS
jgi:hypothetical protein